MANLDKLMETTDDPPAFRKEFRRQMARVIRQWRTRGYEPLALGNSFVVPRYLRYRDEAGQVVYDEYQYFKEKG